MSEWGVVIATVVGSIVATLAGVLIGALLTSRSQHASWVRATRLEAAANVLESYSKIYDELQYWSTKGQRPEIDWTGWNQSLSRLSLVAEAPVMVAAYSIDAAFWRMDEQIKAGATGHTSWIRIRHAAENACLDFTNSCRTQFIGPTTKLATVVGRPMQSDPMWQSWAQRHQADHSVQPLNADETQPNSRT
jgi:hypothetical protein